VSRTITLTPSLTPDTGGGVRPHASVYPTPYREQARQAVP
jgi:hypothetical protein